MLKYGRNKKKMTFCVFIAHERQKLFGDIITCPDMGATLCMGHKHAISVK